MTKINSFFPKILYEHFKSFLISGSDDDKLTEIYEYDK